MERFRRIVINGKTLDLEGALAAIDTFNDVPWVTDLRSTFQELMGTDKPITIKTSGTTGKPKEIIFQREELISSAKLTGNFFHLKEGDRALLCLPTQYIAGKMMVVRAMVLGLDLEIVPPQGNVLEHLHQPFPRFASMIPLQFEKTLTDETEAIEKHFETIILGGGPVPPQLEKRIAELDVRIWHTYGMTETCTHIAARSLTKKAGSTAAGKEHFKALGETTFSQDDRGCVIIHTPHLNTKRHITNDVVGIHDNSKFRWLGRHDNVVLSGGMKLYPEELEERCSALIGRPFFFTGITDPALGQKLIGVMEGEEFNSAEMASLEKSLSTVLGKYEMPKRWDLISEFARNSNGKIDRRATVAALQTR